MSGRSHHDDAIHLAALRLVEATIRKLQDLRGTGWDGVEIHCLANLRTALDCCRECGGNKEHGRGSALRCICTPQMVEEEMISLPPDPDYKRDAKRNGDF